MNERVRKLKKRSLKATAHIDMERARLLTEAYERYEGKVSQPELRALALKHLFTHKTIAIEPGELLVGEKAAMPQGAPTFPELCCHSVEDLETMDSRKLIRFAVRPQDIVWQKEKIIPFWQERSLKSRIMKEMSQPWQAAYEAGVFTEFMEQRGPGHTVGSEIIYTQGFRDHQAAILQAISQLDDHSDPMALAKREQLRAMHIACEAILILAARFAKLAAQQAAQSKDSRRKKELEQIRDNCIVVPAQAPQTAWQALQMYWFVHLAVTSEINPWDAFSPGRLDQHLQPFYASDVAAGRLDDAGMLELLECLWIKFNNQPAPPKVGITLKESGTYTDFANINSGGITPTGQDGVNEISYLILDCMEEMRLLQPSSNVQISRKTPSRFLRRACEIARQGWGQPAFYNTEAIMQELLNAGKTLADARCGGASGCVETGAFGREAYILTGYFNLPKILELTLNEGIDPQSGRKIGLNLGKAEDFSSFEALLAAWDQQLGYFIDLKIAGNNVIEKMYAQYLPVPFLSVITKDCMTKGQDYNAGGARYNTRYLQGVGIGTITDSLAAIQRHVYTEKTVAMTDLIAALRQDYEGQERLRVKLKNQSPCYGNNDDEADSIMRQVFWAYHDRVSGRPSSCGGTYRINMLPTTCHIYFGEVLGASANGRKARQPVSDGISPDKGADRNGPTAVLLSAAKMDHLATGGTLLNLKFAPQVLSEEKGLEQMATLIRTYFSLDGHHVQFNVVDAETLRQAQADPETYANLIVRVAGYSDYFGNLSRALQDEIMARTEHRL